MKRTAVALALVALAFPGHRPLEGQQNASSQQPPASPASREEEGVFRLHSQGGRVLFEIPPRGLGRYFDLQVYNTEPVDTLAWKHEGWAGATLRFERVDSTLALVRWNVPLLNDPGEAAERPEQEVVRSFPILARDPVTGADLIDPSDLFLSPPEDYRWGIWGVTFSGMDEGESVLGSVSSTEHSFTVHVTHTYLVQPEGTGAPDTIVVPVAYRALFWPERAAEPRACDPGMSLFARPVAPGERGVECILYHRRLVPAHPETWPSDPVEPIVFYVDPDTPERWLPWVIRGVEMWEPVFRAAGFSNAIEATLAPSAAEDPGFDFYDTQHSAIYWNPRGGAAWGSHWSDLRSGQILRGAVQIGGGFASSIELAYWAEAAGSDPGLRRLPLPDSVLGPSLAGIIAHEVGHTLGFPHNHVASGTVPVDSLRSRSFTCEEGLTPTVMDYPPHNYVAQPGDGACTLNRRMGAWDYEVIQWLYGRPEPSGEGSGERPGVAASLHWIPRSEFDYRTALYALGDDPIAATGLGLGNIQRLARLVTEYDEELIRRDEPGSGGVRGRFDRLVLTWQRELTYVVGLVGGVVEEREPGSVKSAVTYLPSDRQAEAVRFLVDHAFSPPAFFLSPDLENALPDPPALSVAAAQRALLRSLLSDERLLQVEASSRVAPDPYGVGRLLADLAAGLFPSDEEQPIPSSVLGRRVQGDFVERLIEIRGAAGLDAPRLKASVDLELRDLSRWLTSLADAASLTEVARHYRDLAGLIDRATR